MSIPEYLEPYAGNYDAARAKLKTPEVPLFDGLWERACNNTLPALSWQERQRLIDFLDGKGPP